jgi:protein required for attachment to host cells
LTPRVHIPAVAAWHDSTQCAARPISEHSEEKPEFPMPNAIPTNALVIVCDARKALFLANTGTATAPKLEAVETLQAPDNPRTAESGTDRPGRTATPVGRKSAMEPTDLHDLAETRFAREVAEAIEQRSGDNDRPLFLVAPPRFIAVLRESYGARTRAALRLEITKDLVKQPLPEILEALRRA